MLKGLSSKLLVKLSVLLVLVLLPLLVIYFICNIVAVNDVLNNFVFVTTVILDTASIIFTTKSCFCDIS